MANGTQKMNINTVTAEEIKETVSMIGDRKASAIVRYRENHGGFQHLGELRNILGFDTKLRNALEEYFYVGDMEDEVDTKNQPKG